MNTILSLVAVLVLGFLGVEGGKLLHTRGVEDNEIYGDVFCEHGGQTYNPGDSFTSEDDVCEECTCPATGGHVRCLSRDCAVAQCVDPYHAEGECCAWCPTGNNCLLDGDIIPGYQHVIVPYGPNCSTICRCPGVSAYEQDGVNTEAACSSTCK